MADTEINRQALMIAYIDDFWLMMIVSLLAIPLLLLLKKGRGPTPRRRRDGTGTIPNQRDHGAGELASLQSVIGLQPCGRSTPRPPARSGRAIWSRGRCRNGRRPGEVVALQLRRQAGRDVERGPGLADAADVVALAFDGEQGDVA